MNTLRIIWIIIILTIVYGFLNVTGVLAAPMLVHPAYEVKGVQAEYSRYGGDGFCNNPPLSAMSMPVYDYTVSCETDTTTKDKHTDNDTSVAVDTSAITETFNTPPTVQPTESPKHCNNGEGNGSEGCSPANSDHANNDENNTTPREDKSNK